MTATCRRHAHRVAVLGLLLVSLCPLSVSGQQPAPKNVLMLLQLSEGDAGQRYSEALRAQLDAESNVVLFGEMHDFNRVNDVDSGGALRTYLEETYSDTEIDLVITVGGAPLRFVLRSGLFPGTPVAYSAVPGYTIAAASLPPRVTGIKGHFNIDPTLELARQLQPDANRILLVAGSSERDQLSLRVAETALLLYEGRFEIDTLTGLTIDETERQLAEISPDTIVIALTMQRDAAGRRFLPPNIAIRRIAAASAVPVYGIYETQMGDGIVGVVGDDFASLGAETGALAVTLLSGMPPSDIPARFGETRTLVDWRQLERFGLDEDLLPAEAEIQFREPGIWQRYRSAILGVAALIALQGLLILLFLVRSQQRQTERKLESSEARYREVVEAQDDAVCRFRPDGTLTFVNGALCRRFGLEREDLVGRPYMDLLPEPRRSMALERIRVMLEKPETRTFDLEIRNADGSSRWEHWIERPIVDEKGQVVEIQGIARDITQLKNAEREARIQNERITHLTRVAILGEFSGALAHELNQPLTAIMSDAQAGQIILAQNKADATELKEIMDDIVANNRRARDVILGLRKLLRSHTTDPAPLDANELVRDVLTLTRSVMIDKNVVVSTDLAGNLPRVQGDEVQLQQVLLNLLMNASEAVGANDKGDRHIWVSTRQEDRCKVQLTVRDNGPGIDRMVRSRLFEPYFTTKHEGLGLGLSICRSIVESHGGRLVVDNELSAGACIHCVLPALADSKLEFESTDVARMFSAQG